MRLIRSSGLLIPVVTYWHLCMGSCNGYEESADIGSTNSVGGRRRGLNTRKSTIPPLVVIFYRPQRSWSKVIFSEACVKNSVHRGGGSATLHAGMHPPPRDQRQAPPPPMGPEAGTPPPAQCMLGDTGNKRAVRILMECNLVMPYFRRTMVRPCYDVWTYALNWSLFSINGATVLLSILDSASCMSTI